MKMKLYILVLMLCTQIAPTFAQMDINCLLKNTQVPSFENLEDWKDEFKQVLKESQFVLTGEIHTIWASDDIRFDFFQFLHKNFGFNYLLLEESVSSGYLINEYLQTGNEVLLDQVYKTLDNPINNKRNEIRKEKIKALHQLNLQLEESEKIRIVGLDVERQGTQKVVAALIEIQKTLEAGSPVKTLVDALLKELEESKSDKALKKTVNQMLESELFKTVENQAFSYQEYIIEGILVGLYFKLSKKPYLLRDQFMFDRFRKLKALKAKGNSRRYFFQIGLNHLKPRNGWFADLILKAEEKTKRNKTLLIRYDYFDFKKSIYGNLFKKSEIAAFKMTKKQLNLILGDSNKLLTYLKDCDKESQIDFSLLIRKK